MAAMGGWRPPHASRPVGAILQQGLQSITCGRYSNALFLRIFFGLITTKIARFCLFLIFKQKMGYVAM
jgi:hypothetical protein